MGSFDVVVVVIIVDNGSLTSFSSFSPSSDFSVINRNAEMLDACNGVGRRRETETERDGERGYAEKESFHPRRDARGEDLVVLGTWRRTRRVTTRSFALHSPKMDRFCEERSRFSLLKSALTVVFFLLRRDRIAKFFFH